MIWMTWRQFRTQAFVAAAALAIAAVVLLVTGLHVAHLYSSDGLPGCGAGSCTADGNNFINQLKGSSYELVFYGGVFLVYAVPALVGVFWGAPLITRELEAGTFRLAWNQSVTRRRWLAVKLGVIGLTAMATAGLLSLMTGWWASPIYRAAKQAGTNTLSVTRIEPALFGAQGIAPIGYAAFGFALGVTLGVLIRRTIPAMATTLAVYAGIQIAWPTWVRPHLMSPLRSLSPLNVSALNELAITQTGAGPVSMTVVGAPHVKSGAWLLANQTVTSSGKLFTGPPTNACINGSQQRCTSWLAAQHLRQLVTYQPASRFWDLQWYETAIFLVAALALVAVCAWRIRSRRLA